MARSARAFRRVLREEPVLIGAAIRGTLLALGGFGLNLSGETVAVVMVAVESWLALFSRLAVSRRVKTAQAQERVDTIAEVNAMGDG